MEFYNVDVEKTHFFLEGKYDRNSLASF